MKLVISQPMYLPWPGLFEQMREADIFVHYDDVALPQGRSFISRVQLKKADETEWLTVPVQRKSGQLIQETLLDSSQDWRRKHVAKLEHSLAKAPCYQELAALLSLLSNYDGHHLSELNITLLEHIADYLGFAPKFARSSALGTTSHSSQKLLDICRHYGATEYITGHGARNYLDHELFEQHGIAVKYMDYHIAPYPQFGHFTPYVTVLDLIAHCGKDAVQYMQSNTVLWKEFIDE